MCWPFSSNKAETSLFAIKARHYFPLPISKAWPGNFFLFNTLWKDDTKLPSIFLTCLLLYSMPAKTNKPLTDDNELFTYRRIRKSIGLLGVLLPIVLLCFSLINFFNTQIQPSISHYYYTNLRDIFTGTLYAVGLFLFLYKGHTNKSFLKNDNLLTNIAGVMATGVALVPTFPAEGQVKEYSVIPWDGGWFHYGFAAVLFWSSPTLLSMCLQLARQRTPLFRLALWMKTGYTVYAVIQFLSFS